MNLAPSRFDQTSSTKEYAIGQQFTDGSDRTFRYTLAGGTTLARGKLAVAPAVVANHLNMSFATAPAVDDRSVSITLGATALTADYYADGWLVVQDGTGEGRSYPVEGHPAADSAGTVTIYLKEGIDTAGALAETNVDLLANDWSGAVISVSDQLDRPIGVAVVAITNAEYGWLQTGGNCATLIDETIAIGGEVTIGSSTGGAVELLDAAGEPPVGICGATGGVDTEYQNIYLTIDNSNR